MAPKMAAKLSDVISHQRQKIPIIRSLTCTTAGMIESVVTLAPANVQQTKALVLKCCRVGWTHWLLVRRAVVITNTTGIKCRESFADGMVIASNVCARVYIFRVKNNKKISTCMNSKLTWRPTSFENATAFYFFKILLCFSCEENWWQKKIGNGELLFLQKRLKRRSIRCCRYLNVIFL